MSVIDSSSVAAAGRWAISEVSSPKLDDPVPVVVARDIPYVANANRFQNVTIYLPGSEDNRKLAGLPVSTLPGRGEASDSPRYQVHFHGGAWRDPFYDVRSIEPAVAHTFGAETTLKAIIGINYTLSSFPTHPFLPYDPIRDNHSDLSREAVHPQQVSDALRAFALLRELGVGDLSYVLTGHSAGSCLSFQALLQSPSHWGLNYLPEAPCPVAQLGLNGLYDLPALVHELGPTHEYESDDYKRFLSNTFGRDESAWPLASPALFDATSITERVQVGRAPRLVTLGESAEDQLVPMNQRDRFRAKLSEVDGLRVVDNDRLTGLHAAVWQEGYMIAESVRDALELLGSRS